MQYVSRYESPLGSISLAADEEGITGIWFEGQRYFAHILGNDYEERETPFLIKAKEWLDIYFAGRAPGFKVPVHFIGTEFQKEVWKILNEIPYGQTVTYGSIAEILAKRRGLKRMSAQAVGGAVGHNNISIIVPCHRVIGANGNLTGYGGGIEKKVELLRIEGVAVDSLYYKFT